MQQEKHTTGKRKPATVFLILLFVFRLLLGFFIFWSQIIILAAIPCPALVPNLCSLVVFDRGSNRFLPYPENLETYDNLWHTHAYSIGMSQCRACPAPIRHHASETFPSWSISAAVSPSSSSSSSSSLTPRLEAPEITTCLHNDMSSFDLCHLCQPYPYHENTQID